MRPIARAPAIFLGGLLLCATEAGMGGSADCLKGLGGLSGKLRFLLLDTEDSAPLVELGAEIAEPGVHPFLARPSVKSKASELSVVLLTPFSEKVAGKIGGYLMGSWPEEQSSGKKSPYKKPAGFIKVTKDTAKRNASEHFEFGDFLTKDQEKVWPKYLVLDPRLLDKLELLIVELGRQGTPVKGLHVMSGFRTPQYNDQDLGPGARSGISRHMYGDAADVYPDDDGDGRLDDLNRDGRIDLADARLLAKAAEGVEKRYPTLVGGIGIYPATAAHGPFVHVDVRGSRARWGEK